MFLRLYTLSICRFIQALFDLALHQTPRLTRYCEQLSPPYVRIDRGTRLQLLRGNWGLSDSAVGGKFSPDRLTGPRLSPVVAVTVEEHSQAWPIPRIVEAHGKCWLPQSMAIKVLYKSIISTAQTKVLPAANVLYGSIIFSFLLS